MAGAFAGAMLAGALVVFSGCKDDEKSREALAAVLTEHGSISQSDYTAESYQSYKEAYEKAMTAYEDKESEKELLDSVKKGLEDSIDALVPRADLTALLALLEQEYPEKKYTSESYEVYKTAYAKAQNVSKDTDAKQSVVNSAAEVLKKAIEGLQEKADVSKLGALVMGLISQDGYTTASYNHYIEVYDEARELYNQYDEEMDEKDAEDFEQNVSICIPELESAIEGLEKKGDLAALQALYEQLSPAYKAASEATGGYAPAQFYTAESYTAFGMTLEEVLGVLDTGDYSQKQIDEYLIKLQAAYDGLLPRSDTAALEALILSVTKYYLSDVTLYTGDSFVALNNALNGAKDLVGEGKNPTQESVDQALRAILGGIGGLRPAKPVEQAPAYRCDSMLLKCGSASTTVGEYLRDSATFYAAVLALPADAATVTATADGSQASGVRAKFEGGVEAVFSEGRVHIGLQSGVTAITGDSRGASVSGVYLGMSYSGILNALGGIPTELKTESGMMVMRYRDSEAGCQMQITLDATSDAVTEILFTVGK